MRYHVLAIPICFALLFLAAGRTVEERFHLALPSTETKAFSTVELDTASRLLLDTASDLPLPLFPEDNIWNTRIDHLPVHPRSDDYIARIGLDKTLHPDFGSGVWPPGSTSPIGIPYCTVPGDQALVPITFYYSDESDSGPYPIPPDAPIEGGPDSSGDRHVLVVDRDNAILYELYDAWPQEDGSWQAGSGAIFDLKSNTLRPEGMTSADAAGLPILPGLVRYEEVASGAVNHAIRFTASRTQRAYVWPARHYASTITDQSYPPMGQRFRLKADFDTSGFSPPVQVLLEAFKLYGLILADNGSDWYISGVPDERWDNSILRELRRVPGSAFEAVDVSSLMVDPDSGQAGDGDETPEHTVIIYWQNIATGELNAWFINSSSKVGAKPLTPDRHNINWHIAAVGDISGNGSPDLLWQNQNTGRLLIWIMNGLDKLAEANLPMINPNWKVACIHDIDGDGQADIVLENIFGRRQVWLMDGTIFRKGFTLAFAGTNWRIAAIASMEDDANHFVIWEHLLHGRRTYWTLDENYRKMPENSGPFHQTGMHLRIAAVHDIDGDGKADIIWQHNDGRSFLWLMDELTGEPVWRGPIDSNSPQWRIVGCGKMTAGL